MPRHPNAIIRPNNVLSDARKRRLSPVRVEQRMSRVELADAVNAALDRLYPGRDLDAFLVDFRWIGKIERGEHRWPSEERRAALREVFGVDSDADLGLYSPRRSDAASAGLASSAFKEPTIIDTSVCHPARRYNYWLGGKDHFKPDRESGDMIARAFPTVITAAKENRAFQQRAVRFLADAGIRQFLDIGTGLPAPDNTHEVAQRVAPNARVVYVDNDPIVMVHSRALTIGDPQGRTTYLEADLRDPEAILKHPTLTDTLDMSQPIGLLLVAVLHFFHDDDQALAVVRHLLDALPAGSYLAFSHFTMDFNTPELIARYDEMYAAGRADARPRSGPQFARFLDGLDIVEPGIVAVSDWRPESENRPSPAEVSVYGAVGRIR